MKHYAYKKGESRLLDVIVKYFESYPNLLQLIKAKIYGLYQIQQV